MSDIFLLTAHSTQPRSWKQETVSLCLLLPPPPPFTFGTRFTPPKSKAEIECNRSCQSHSKTPLLFFDRFALAFEMWSPAPHFTKAHQHQFSESNTSTNQLPLPQQAKPCHCRVTGFVSSDLSEGRELTAPRATSGKAWRGAHNMLSFSVRIKLLESQACPAFTKCLLKQSRKYREFCFNRVWDCYHSNRYSCLETACIHFVH